MDTSDFEKILELSSEHRYEFFLDTAVVEEELWFLTDKDGDVITLSTELEETVDYIPLWPAKEFAEYFIADAEQELVAQSINIFEFLEQWIPALHEDSMNVGIFPNLEVTVWIIAPLDLQQDIVEELGIED